MALLKSKATSVPENAVVLSELEALKYQMDIVAKWHKSSEVFALRYGPYILGSAALLSGAFINNHFRRKFMLGHYGRLSSYIPICVMPGVLTTLFHTELVLRQVLLMKSDQCPVCLESRAAALQAFLAVAFPVVVAPVGCAALATRYATYDLPYLHEKPKEVFNIFRKMFSRIQTKTFYLLIGQAFLGSVVTYFEASNLINISKGLSRSRLDEELLE